MYWFKIIGISSQLCWIFRYFEKNELNSIISIEDSDNSIQGALASRVSVNPKQYTQNQTKPTTTVYSICPLRIVVWSVSCCSMFFVRPFCHGALNVDLSTLFSTFFLRTYKSNLVYFTTHRSYYNSALRHKGLFVKHNIVCVYGNQYDYVWSNRNIFIFEPIMNV